MFIGHVGKRFMLNSRGCAFEPGRCIQLFAAAAMRPDVRLLFDLLCRAVVTTWVVGCIGLSRGSSWTTHHAGGHGVISAATSSTATGCRRRRSNNHHTMPVLYCWLQLRYCAPAVKKVARTRLPSVGFRR